MVASRNKPEGGLRTSLWLGVMMLLALPSEVGYQDLATLLTRQPVVNRAQKTAFASTFGTIHEAPYNLPEPVGASIPIPSGYMLAGLDAGHADVTASLRDRLFGAGQPAHFDLLAWLDRVATMTERDSAAVDLPEPNFVTIE